MKKLIVLSGNSARNQAWGEGAVAHFGPWFSEVYMQYYDHWVTGSKEMDVAAELQKLEAAVAQDEGYIVLAKSIGSLVALLAIHKGILKPGKCVFFGMPLDLASDGLFKDDWSPLSTLRVPSLAFHNVDDPVASFAFTQSKLEEHTEVPIELIELAGDNHDYLDFADYEETIKAFFGQDFDK